MADKKTLEQYNIQHGLSNEGSFPCEQCQNPLPSFALVEVTNIPELDGDFVCGTCVIDLQRSQTPTTTGPTLTWDDVRSFRSLLLMRCDWTQTRDASESISALWAPVRTSLRNITTDYSTVPAAWAALKQIETQNFS